MSSLLILCALVVPFAWADCKSLRRGEMWPRSTFAYAIDEVDLAFDTFDVAVSRRATKV